MWRGLKAFDESGRARDNMLAETLWMGAICFLGGDRAPTVGSHG